MADGDWDDRLRPEWAGDVASWPWQPWGTGGAGWVKTGTCSVCHHQMAVYQHVVVALQPGLDDRDWVDAFCNCGQPHPNRPPDDTHVGCGQQARVAANGLPPAWRPVVPPPADQAEWDKAAVGFAIDQLTRIRSSAEKWSGVLTALLGLFGTVALVAGPDKLAGFSNEALKAAVYVLVPAAGVCAGAAIVYAALAAYGSLPHEEVNWSGTAYREWVLAQARTATDNLGMARFVGALAAVLVFAVGFIGLVDALNPSPRAATTVVVVDTGGNAFCGPAGSASGTLTVGGKVVPKVASVTPVGSC